MASSTIVRRTKTRWVLATNELFDRENGEPSINWNTLLSKVSGGTKHQRSYLLKSVRGFIEALADAPRDQRRPDGEDEFLAHGTILNWYWEVRRLVTWMTERNIWKFSSLSSEDVYCYIQERMQRQDGRGAVSPHTRYFRLLILRQMWMLRSRYVAPLRVNPLTLEIPIPRGAPRSSWKAIEEGAAMALVKDALEWIDSTGPFIVEVMDRIWTQSKAVGLNKGQRSVARTRLYAALENVPDVARLRSLLAMPNQKTYNVLRAATMLTNGACVIVVLFLIGLRIGEFARLDHDCLVEDRDSSGIDVTRLRGIAAKQGGRQRSWIACDEVATVVNQILRLTANARKESGRKSLWLNQLTGSFFHSGFRQRRTDAGVLTEYMKRFAYADFRSASPPIKRIHPHAARKTFARFVVLRNKSALGPLARHFGHISTSITDGAYVGSDIELEKMLSEEGRLDLARNLMDLLVAPHAAGKAADAIAKARSLVPTFKGRKGLERFVDKLIDDGVQLAPCDWGYCVYSQALSACHGDSRGPNEARRSPDVCSTCANFAVTHQHRPWWEARLRQDDEFLERPGLTEQTVTWVKRRRANSAKIVAGLLPLVRDSRAGGV
jgi:integrase